MNLHCPYSPSFISLISRMPNTNSGASPIYILLTEIEKIKISEIEKENEI